MYLQKPRDDRRVRAVLIAGAMAFSALVAWKSAGTGGDYTSDAGPAIGQFAAGHFLKGLREPTPLMGPLSILVRFPFVAVAHAFGSGRTTDYRLGCFVCILPAGLIAAALARRATDKRALGLLFVVVAIATPAVTNAVELGHPEEILAAALAVSAVTAATGGRRWATAILLGLAVATKQWAALAPFILSLLAWESVARRRVFPYLTIGSVTCLVVTESVLEGRLSE